MTEVMLKATSANGFAAFLAREFPKAELKSILAELPPGEAELFTGDLPATATVPFSAMNRLTVIAARKKGEPLQPFARRAGVAIAEYATRTVYKYVLVFMSPQRILKTAPLAWSRIFDRGVMTVEIEHEHGRIRLRDFAPDTAGCARITGWFEFVGNHSAKNMNCVHSACAAEGAAECLWDFTWSE